ncbi:TetR/AcrR family transcriptional regulator [Hyphomonas sp.]|jgi:AcrR family transcriptional regulator|uniref:TetR/AcrR family transcriptional regulator n=1 Tax=Hyphomonas sp. TaxID=87 RepID=UPI003563082E
MPSSIDTLSSGKRAKSKAANRRAILEAGRRVFARIGFDATTVRDIIRETELAAGTFYNYFKCKEDVFEAIAEDSTYRFRTRLSDVRARATTFEDYIHQAYHAYFSFIAAENAEAIRGGAPHLALIGVRVDTPEMLAIADEIRSDLDHVLKAAGAPVIDIDYLTAAAIGIAREMGDHMLQRRPVNADAATEFASALLLAGVREIAGKAV